MALLCFGKAGPLTKEPCALLRPFGEGEVLDRAAPVGIFDRAGLNGRSLHFLRIDKKRGVRHPVERGVGTPRNIALDL